MSAGKILIQQKRRMHTMGVAINVKSLEEVPEIMREFVTAIFRQ
jgi:hypothetical protein